LIRIPKGKKKVKTRTLSCVAKKIRDKFKWEKYSTVDINMHNNLTYTKNVQKTRKNQFEQGTQLELLPAVFDRARKTVIANFQLFEK